MQSNICQVMMYNGFLFWKHREKHPFPIAYTTQEFLGGDYKPEKHAINSFFTWPDEILGYDHCYGDFDIDGDVDSDDVDEFLLNFGRSQYNTPCTTCAVEN